MTRCTTLDQAVLTKTKIDKVLPRLVKKGDDEGKDLAQRVLNNAAAISKQKSGDGKPLPSQETKEKNSKTTSIAKPLLEHSRPSNNVPGIKKPRAENAAEQPVKKISTEGRVSSGTTTARSSALLRKRQQPAKIDPKTATKPTPSSAPTPKVKTNHISAKPSGFFSSLQSASKKPGTSNAAILSAKSKEGKDG